MNYYRTALIILFIAGISLIGWGTAADETFWKQFFTAIGAAILGASLGLLASDIFADSVIDKIRTLIEQRINSAFVSAETDASTYRRRWHHYHVTKMKNKYVWRYRIYDFQRFDVPGLLTAHITAIDNQGSMHKYIATAWTKDSRFCIVEKAEVGQEPVIVEIYPYMGMQLHGVHTGVGVMQSWDGEDLLFPCILAQEPVVQAQQEGTLPETVFETLDATWKASFTKKNQILPRT